MSRFCSMISILQGIWAEYLGLEQITFEVVALGMNRHWLCNEPRNRAMQLRNGCRREGNIQIFEEKGTMGKGSMKKRNVLRYLLWSIFPRHKSELSSTIFPHRVTRKIYSKMLTNVLTEGHFTAATLVKQLKSNNEHGIRCAQHWLKRQKLLKGDQPKIK